MYCRTASALVSIVFWTFAFWSVKASGVTTTGSPDVAASISTESYPTVTSDFKVEETTLSPVSNQSLDSTFYTVNTTSVSFTKLSVVTTPTPTKNVTEAGSTNIASTTLPTSVAKGLVSNTIISSTTSATSTTDNVGSTANKINNTTTVLSTNATSESNTTLTSPVESNTTIVVSGDTGTGMKYSETVLTSIFGTILVVVLLTILAICFTKYRKQHSQYSHRPLHENIYESDGYSQPDDTLVISGGLYDAPRIYNPNMTVLEEDETQPEYVSFSNRPGQFRLEFLPGDKDVDPAYNGSLRRNV